MGSPTMTAGSAPTILIADDYHQMRLAVHHVLNDMQLRDVQIATQGYEARQILDTMNVSIVIADWNMPGMTGYELLCWCRNDPRYKQLPFILLTAESSREHLAKAVSAGVTDYLVKPFTSAVLKARIARLLRQPGSEANRHPGKPLPVELPLLGLDAPSEERLARSTVLVVDDVATNIEVITGILKDDYSVKVAINGRKALEIASSNTPPDLILLDVMMPEMDGYEVCRRLKSDPKTASIPVIFLTARDQADDVVDGFDLGAVDYIAKPVQPTVLKARLRTHLKLSQALRDLNRQNATLADNARLRDDIERLTRHDLKSPIAAIAQTVEGMLRDPDCGGAVAERLVLLDGAARHALELVNVSMTLYRIEQGDYQLEAETIDLGEIVQSVIQEVDTLFAWRNVTIRFDRAELIRARAEAVLCRSALTNLLKNAVEASPDASEVLVAATMNHDECLLEISNRGVVPQAIRNRFFDKYVTHGKADGTGLGTYSAKLLVEAQHGTIALHSDDAGGMTQIRITLPRAS
ncbi:MAG: response regulator [Burkholderiales bacterium]|nr:response regulator [Burkholderiales bacterium]